MRERVAMRVLKRSQVPAVGNAVGDTEGPRVGALHVPANPAVWR